MISIDPDAEHVLTIVARYYGLARMPEILREPRGGESLLDEARGMAALFLHEKLGMSFEHIGETLSCGYTGASLHVQTTRHKIEEEMDNLHIVAKALREQLE
jgi:hypothetical protein